MCDLKIPLIRIGIVSNRKYGLEIISKTFRGKLFSFIPLQEQRLTETANYTIKRYCTRNTQEFWRLCSDEWFVFHNELRILQNSEIQHLAYTIYQVQDKVLYQIVLSIESKWRYRLRNLSQSDCFDSQSIQDESLSPIVGSKNQFIIWLMERIIVSEIKDFKWKQELRNSIFTDF